MASVQSTKVRFWQPETPNPTYHEALYALDEVADTIHTAVSKDARIASPFTPQQIVELIGWVEEGLLSTATHKEEEPHYVNVKLEVNKQAAHVIDLISHFFPDIIDAIPDKITVYQRLIGMANRPTVSQFPGPVVRSLLGAYGFHNEVVTYNAAVDFRDTVLGLLLTPLASSNAVLLNESWMILQAVLRADEEDDVVVHFLLAHIAPIIKFLTSTIDSGHYVAKRQGLKMVTMLVSQQKFNKVRSKLLDSPALLIAVMRSLNDPSHHVRYEAFHAIKIFIAKPTKSLPVRHVFSANRDMLAKFIAEYSAGDEANDVEINNDKALLRDRLLSTPALTREDLVLLDHLKSVDD